MKGKVYNLQEIDDIPESPGIYGWYLSIGDSTRRDDYFSMFQQKEIRLEGKGNLGDLYYGLLQNTIRESPSKEYDNKFLLIASTFLSPPVYIGVSKNVKARIEQHLDGLRKIVFRSQEGLIEKDDANIFANRIGRVINTLEKKDINMFRIKVIELPLSYPYSDLLDIEKFLNKTYTPLYGQR